MALLHPEPPLLVLSCWGDIGSSFTGECGPEELLPPLSAAIAAAAGAAKEDVAVVATTSC